MGDKTEGKCFPNQPERYTIFHALLEVLLEKEKKKRKKK